MNHLMQSNCRDTKTRLGTLVRDCYVLLALSQVKQVPYGIFLFVCLGFNGTFSTNRLSRHDSRIICHVGAGDNTNT